VRGDHPRRCVRPVEERHGLRLRGVSAPDLTRTVVAAHRCEQTAGPNLLQSPSSHGNEAGRRLSVSLTR
jgi:hypothetical protein